jgi:hypothetical protein
VVELKAMVCPPPASMRAVKPTSPAAFGMTTLPLVMSYLPEWVAVVRLPETLATAIR